MFSAIPSQFVRHFSDAEIVSVGNARYSAGCGSCERKQLSGQRRSNVLLLVRRKDDWSKGVSVAENSAVNGGTDGGVNVEC